MMSLGKGNRFISPLRRSSRDASARAIEKMQTPGVMSPQKGIVRNSNGKNQFPCKRKRSITLRSRIIPETPPSKLTKLRRCMLYVVIFFLQLITPHISQWPCVCVCVTDESINEKAGASRKERPIGSNMKKENKSWKRGQFKTDKRELQITSHNRLS